MAKSKRKKILIAEDEVPMARALTLKLNKAGFDVTATHDGQEAVDALDKDKFDMILLDIIMPRMNGFEVMAELKKRKIKAPVVILSNLSQEEDAQKAKKDGAIDYFVKSDISLGDIVKYIENTLKK